MDSLRARWVKGTKQSGGPFFFFFFKFIPRNTQQLDLSPFFLSTRLLLIATVRTLTWELNCSKSCNLYSCSPKFAPLILEFGKVRFSICHKEWEKYYELYFIQSTAVQFLRSVPEVGCYYGSNPRNSDGRNVWFSAQWEGVFGKSRYNIHVDGDTWGSWDNLTAHRPGETLPQKACSSWRMELCSAPLEALWLPGLQPAPKRA